MQEMTEKEKALQQRWRTMFWPSSTSLLPETTASEQDATAAEGSKKRPLPEDKDATPRPPKKRKERESNGPQPPKKPRSKKPVELQAAKTMRIQVLPSQDQKYILNKWMGTVRWIYNQGVAFINQHGVKDNLNLKTLRAAIVNNDTHKGRDTEWVLETPYDIRDDAIRDLIKAYDSNFDKKKLNPEHKFFIQFKSKKRGCLDNLTLHGKHLKPEPNHPRKFGLYPTFFTKKVGPLLCAEPLSQLALTITICA